MTITLIATTTMGFESVLANEIKALGFQNVRVLNTKVEFEAKIADIAVANLWLRTAGRIYIKIAEFKATTFDELFEKTKSQPWSRWIQKNDQFPVTQVSSVKSTLFSKSDSQSVVKKAVVEHLKQAHKVRSLPETGARFAIRIQIDKDIVTLSIDSSGAGLNKRGYRAHMDKAPLRETLAAGLVLLSRFRADKDVLIDPMCGSGTILIEAALIARNIAPGLNRSFASEKWSLMSSDMWLKARKAAKAQIKPNEPLEIMGFDISNKALSIARNNISLAGLSDIHIQKQDIKDLSCSAKGGKIICNPPYGERLGEIEEAEALYKEMGKTFKRELPTWSYYILSPAEEFEWAFGQKSTKHRKVFNGGLQCYFYQYFGPRNY